MKTNCIKFLMVGLILLSRVVNGQSLLVYTGLERTVAGNQYGTSLLFETKKLLAIGGFYQVSAVKTFSEGTIYKDPFYGLMFQAPLAKTDRLSFFAVLRTGFVNHDFFALVPSFETRIHISSRVGIMIGTGFRHAYPSISGKVFLKLL